MIEIHDRSYLQIPGAWCMSHEQNSNEDLQYVKDINEDFHYERPRVTWTRLKRFTMMKLPGSGVGIGLELTVVEPDTGAHDGGVNVDRLAITIGNQLRTLRKERGLTLGALSARSGISTGLISQVERGKGNPSFTSMVQLAHGLEVPIGRLFHVPDAISPVVRKGERRHLDVHGRDDGSTYQLLTPHLEGALEVVWVETPPGHDTSSTPFRHNGEECGVLLSGTKEVYLDGAKHTLHAGDAITFSCSVPHWFANPGPEPSVSIWVITPPTW